MLGETITRLRDAVPNADVLIVDDASPDGTGHLAEELAEQDPAISVLHRAGKQGLGKAYVAGFGWALERGYEVIVEMDADASHQPEELPTLLDRIAAADQPDLVLGSRWVPGGSIVDWPRHREWLSRGGNVYVKVVLRSEERRVGNEWRFRRERHQTIENRTEERMVYKQYAE